MIEHEHPDGLRCQWASALQEWVGGDGYICKDTNNTGPLTKPPSPLPRVVQVQVEDHFDNGLIDLLGEVRGLMQDRHRKYGPGNIAKRGIPGILVRLEDKLARIDTGDMDYSDESYRDAWMDVVGYGLIALMWVDGNWPGSPLASVSPGDKLTSTVNERGAEV